GLGVQALAVTLLTNLHGGGNMHQDEAPIGLDHLTYVFAGRVVRGDWGADRNAAVLSDFRSNIPNAADIDVAMLFGESEFRGKVLADEIAVEQGHRTSTDFQELRHQDIGDGRLARTRKSGEEDRDSLF